MPDVNSDDASRDHQTAVYTRFDTPSGLKYEIASVYAGNKLAERVGFEPTIPVKVCPLSRRPVIRR